VSVLLVLALVACKPDLMDSGADSTPAPEPAPDSGPPPSPNTKAIMNSVERRAYGVASAVVGTMRQVGMTFSMGIVMMLLTLHLGQVTIEAGNAAAFVGSMHTAFTVFAEPLTRYHVTLGSISSLTVRRLACSLTIAERHAPSLPDLWWRIVAVHYEAFAAYRAAGCPAQAVLEALRLPLSLLSTTLAPDPAAARHGTAPRAVALALWAWVGVAFGTYLYRFQDLLAAAFNLLGRL